MTWYETLKAVDEVVKVYHTIEKSLVTLEDNFRLIRAETTSLRTEIIQLEGRVSKLEETRNTIAAEVKATVGEAVAEVKVLKAETIAELKVSYVREVAELHRKDMERQITEARDQKLLPLPEAPGN